MEKNQLTRFGYFIENALMSFFRLTFIVIIFFFGYNLLCYSFMGEPPWIASFAGISGFLLIIAGSHLINHDL